MPDAPDGYQYRLESGRHVLADMAELAVRLGSSVAYDRRGTVILVDPCQDDIAGWLGEVVGANSVVSLSDTIAYRHAGSLQLVAGPDDMDAAYVYRNVQVIAEADFGVEITFRVTANIKWVTLTIAYHNGTHRYQGFVRLHAVDNELQYIDEDGVYQALESVADVNDDNDLWHTLKLVVDANDTAYRRICYDSSVHDALGYAMPVVAMDTPPHFYISIIVICSGDNDAQVNVNDFIITIEEP